MRKNGYSNDRFDSSKSRYTLDQLKKAVPRACLRAAERLAKGAEVNKLVLCLVYREPDLTVNLNGIEAALGELSSNKVLSPSEKAEARAELLSEKLKAQRVLGKSSTQSGPSNALGAANRSFFADLAKYRSLPLDSLSMASDAPLGLPPKTFQAPAGLTPEVQAGLSVPSGYNIQSLEVPVMAIGTPGMAPPIIIPPDLHLSQEELAAVAAKQKTGSLETDLSPLPDFRKLGIDRAAGPAIPEEMDAFLGQVKSDNSPVTVNDFFSAGAVLADNNLIPHLSIFFPSEELRRMEAMLKFRSLKSDQDHSRQVASGPFTVVNPKMGTDPGTALNRLHPLLGVEPYTALIARLLFPTAEVDEEQAGFIEAAKRGRFQNLSALFAYESVSCSTCGSVEIKPLKANGAVTGFTADPKLDMFQCSSEDDYRTLSGTFRTPSDVPGGFVYQALDRVRPGANGILQIEPILESQLEINDGTRLLINMDRFSFFSMNYVWCRLHGMLGGRLKDGRQVVGQFTNIRALINMAVCDKGAIGNARICLNPDLKY